MTDKTAELLEKLAAQLGTTTELLWGVLIRQARVELIQNAITIILATLLLGVTWRGLKWSLGETEERDEELAIGITAISTVLAVIAVVVFIVSLYHIPTLIWNPEYWALTEILKAIRK